MNISLAHNLSPCFMSLDNWRRVIVTGADNHTYLQGQLTNDMAQLNENQFMFAAHCDASGKVLSNLCLFQQGEQISYLLRHSVTTSQVDDLKKYAIFAKVNIQIDNNNQLFGIAGANCEQLLITLLGTTPNLSQPVITTEQLTILRFDIPQTRFILLGLPEKITTLRQELSKLGAIEKTDQQWLALDIEANYPIVDNHYFMQFLPQALGLEKIAGISFKKGCYRGQEMVARAQYRGANKRTLFHLIGESSVLPDVGSTLELALGDNWRQTGSILAAVRLADGRVLVQAVLNNDMTVTDKFRVSGVLESQLQIYAYST
ncbi:MAG: tRNA-modifying protein YgfZ [Candidatus Schmidhempelia sp.]|nr:tRNA-modifying protein YgfZ [Candidatus Schmidhempelia sp.]